MGFASSTAEAHNGEGGTPMPSRLADDKELRALVRAMGQGGNGVYMLTKGSKTTIPYLESIAAEVKRPVVIAALFHSNTNPTAAFTWLSQVNEARARGHRLVAQTSCCPLSMDFTFKSPYLFESMEAWKPAMAAHDPAGLTKIYADPAWRDAVRRESARVTTNPGSLSAAAPEFTRLALESEIADKQVAAALASLEAARSLYRTEARGKPKKA